MALVFLLATFATALTVTVSPIEKVLQLLGELEGKIIKDGEAQQKLYEDFADYCKDTSVETQFEIKTAKSDAERFAASGAESAADVSSLETKIEELSTTIATSSADLKAATDIREKEAADFARADQDLAQTVDMLGRAVAIIEKEMRGGSFVQTGAASSVASALQTLVDAASVNSLDKAKVQALLETETDQLQPAGAPDPAAYENKSGGILSVLEDMVEKAQAQRADGQKAEMNANHNFQMLKQSLEGSVSEANKDLSGAKKDKAGAEEKGATAEGDFERTQKEIAMDGKKLKDLQHECMTRAEDFEMEQHERSEELGALNAAKKILLEKTGAAAGRAYALLQTTSTSEDTTTRVVALLRKVAKTSGAAELVQMALRVRSAVGTGADPFGKVKGMIQEMIEKLVSEAQEEAGKKAFCDKEMSETKAKREDKSGEVDDLTTKIDAAAAKIAKLTEGISTLEGELTKIADEQAHATAQREEEKAAWSSGKSDFEQGLEGVQMALQVLRDYYAQKDESFVQSDLSKQMAMTQMDKSSGAAGGIIGMLEVVESDFAKLLADGSAAEDQAQKEYDVVSKDNEVAVATKRTEVKYKQKDLKETQAFLADTKDDLSTSDTELAAVVEYWEKLQPQCVAKPEPYEERKKRREAEIAGLKEALEILETESGSPAFLAVRRS